jgi:transposase InsO family protein
MQRVRLAGELERARNEIALLRETLRIKDARMRRIDPQRRPQYRPTDRMAILELRAAQGWTVARTAETFLVDRGTVSMWMKRLDEKGGRALVNTSEPVNRFPEFVAYVVRRLKALCPTMGRRRIAQVLARAGLHLAASTVRRLLAGRPRGASEAEESVVTEQGGKREKARVVTARYPDHVWHVDLTAVPTTAGLWTAWLPFALPQVWPFCWWMVAAVDHYSRKVLGFALFKGTPSSTDVRAFLGRAIRRAGRVPKYLICDRGRQFDCDGFRRWCKRKKIRPRYGAVGRCGSIAIIERFFGSAKEVSMALKKSPEMAFENPPPLWP